MMATLARERNLDENHGRSYPPLVAWLFRSRLSWALAMMLMLVVGLALAWPVTGQVVLTRVQPREVAAPPDPAQARTIAPRAESGLVELDQLAKELGAPVLLPAYLPPGCTVNQRSFEPTVRVATVAYTCGGAYSCAPGYSCIFVAEQAGETLARPNVGVGSTEAVLINGQPATYIDGIWRPAADGSPGGYEWRPGAIHQVYFERDGLLIRVLAGDGLAKDELLKIAESIH